MTDQTAKGASNGTDEITYTLEWFTSGDVRAAVERAVAAEREAIAELVESLWSPSNPLDGRYLLAAAAAIRNRGEAT